MEDAPKAVCSFEAEIIKIGQSSHKMYNNNILNFQESTTILNACPKKSGKHHLCTLHLVETSAQQSYLVTVPTMPVIKQISLPCTTGYLSLFDTFPNITFKSPVDDKNSQRRKS